MERISPRFGSLLKPVLAGLLGIVVFLAATFSATHSLQHSPHADGADNSHSCFLCSLAKGQITSADTAPIGAFLAHCLVFSARPALKSAPAGWEYRYSPSRAPPSVSSSSTVVG